MGSEMQETMTQQKDSGPVFVGSEPDKMARELRYAVDHRVLPESFTKETAAAHLYVTGFPMVDVVEHIDEALAIFSNEGSE